VKRNQSLLQKKKTNEWMNEWISNEIVKRNENVKNEMERRQREIMEMKGNTWKKKKKWIRTWKMKKKKVVHESIQKWVVLEFSLANTTKKKDSKNIVQEIEREIERIWWNEEEKTNEKWLAPKV
jgi:hypothetical protein